MNEREEKELQKTYASWTLEDLLKALTTDRSQFRPEVLPLIEREVRSRNVAVPVPPAPVTGTKPAEQQGPKVPLGKRLLRVLALILLLVSSVAIANAVTAAILPDKNIAVIAGMGIFALALLSVSILLTRYVAARVPVFRDSTIPRSHDIWLVAIVVACLLSWIGVLAALPEALAWPAIFLTIAAAAIPFKERVFRIRSYLVCIMAIVSTSLLINYPAMFLGMATKRAETRGKDFSAIVEAFTQHATDSNFRNAIGVPTALSVESIKPTNLLLVEAQGDKEPFRCRVSSWDTYVPESQRPRSISDVRFVALVGPRVCVSPRLGPFDQSDATVAIPVLLFRWPEMAQVGHISLSATVVVRKTGSVLGLYWRTFRRETNLADQLRAAQSKAPRE